MKKNIDSNISVSSNKKEEINSNKEFKNKFLKKYIGALDFKDNAEKEYNQYRFRKYGK